MDIRICTLDYLDQAALFAFERNVVQEYRCRPFLIDTSFESIKKDYQEYIEGDLKDILLQYEKDSLIGVTGVYWIEKDTYLSLTRGIFFDGDYSLIAGNFIHYLSERFSSYKLYINTAREHLKSVEYFTCNNFELCEDAVLYELKDYDDFDWSGGVELIDDRNSESIWSCLETIMTPDTYWNTEKVKNSLEKFIVLGYFDKGTQGALYAQIYKDSSVEIFGIAYENTNIAESLIKSLIFRCNILKPKRLWLYTEEESEVNIAVKFGFKYFDSNKCFMRKI